MAQMRVARNGWIDDQGRVLALFGNPDASQFLFDLLTDEQAQKFLEFMKENAFVRQKVCSECQTELFAGNNICPKCGLDNEDK